MAQIIPTGQYIPWHMESRQDTTRFIINKRVKNTVNHLRRYKTLRRLASLIPWSTLCRFPPVVCIELTNRCDLKCVMCHRNFMIRDQGEMDWSRYVRLTEEMGKEQGTMLVLIGQGEPTLYPRFIDAIHQAKKAGIDRVLLQTNGQHLPELAEKIVLSGLDDLHISIDGLEKETVEAIRVGVDMERVTSGVRKALDFRESNGGDKPVIALRYCCMSKNREEQEVFWNFWKDILGENDEVRFIQIQRYREAPISDESAELPCKILWRRLYVRWNGDYAFCCNHRDNRLGIDLSHNEISLREMWHYAGLERIRSLHLRGRKREIESCRICPLMNQKHALEDTG